MARDGGRSANGRKPARQAPAERSLLQLTTEDRNDLSTRELVYRAAIETFAERGYEGSSLRHIATKVGIEAPSLYNHISSKQELLFFLIQQATIELIQFVEARLAHAGPDPLARLGEAVEAHVEFHCRYQRHVVVGDSELRALTKQNYRKTRTARRQYEQLFVDILRDGVDQGLFRPAPVRITAFGIMSMGTSAAWWYRPGGPLTPEQIGVTYRELALRAVVSDEGRLRLDDGFRSTAAARRSRGRSARPRPA